MSAFVCDDPTLNRIVAGIENARRNGDYGKPYPKLPEALAEIIGDSSPSEIGRTLYALNVNAVEQRYPDCIGNPANLPGQIDEDGNHLPYQYTRTIPPQPIQFYKSLKCYLYQCNEGDVDELPLYKALESFVDKFARHLTEGSQSYNKADWE